MHKLPSLDDIFTYFGGSLKIKNSINNNNVSLDNVEPVWDGFYTLFNGLDYFNNETNIQGDPLFCNPENGDYRLAENSPAVGSGENGGNMGAFGIGCNSILYAHDKFIPSKFMLYQNYPNPFNPATSLRYELPEDGLVKIAIYDMMGRIVKTLVNSPQTAGFKSIQLECHQ